MKFDYIFVNKYPTAGPANIARYMSVIQGRESMRYSLKDKLHGCLISTQPNTSDIMQIHAHFAPVIRDLVMVGSTNIESSEQRKQDDIIKRMPKLCCFVSFSHAGFIHGFLIHHVHIQNGVEHTYTSHKYVTYPKPYH